MSWFIRLAIAITSALLPSFVGYAQMEDYDGWYEAEKGVLANAPLIEAVIDLVGWMPLSKQVLDNAESETNVAEHFGWLIGSPESPLWYHIVVLPDETERWVVWENNHTMRQNCTAVEVIVLMVGNEPLAVFENQTYTVEDYFAEIHEQAGIDCSDTYRIYQNEPELAEDA